MNTRLSEYEHQKAIKTALVNYPQNWISYTQGESFEHIVKRTFQDWITKHSGCDYQQLQHKAETGQLTPEEKSDLQQSLDMSNQRLVWDHEKRNQNLQRYYQANRKQFWKNPLKHQKLDPQNYQTVVFTMADSPFTVSAVLDILGQIFGALHEEQTFNKFAYHPNLQEDKERLTLHNQLDTQTDQLTQEHQKTQDKQYVIQAKENELKRKLEQLEHLTRITENYRQLPDTENLTSPTEQSETLENYWQKNGDGKVWRFGASKSRGRKTTKTGKPVSQRTKL